MNSTFPLFFGALVLSLSTVHAQSVIPQSAQTKLIQGQTLFQTGSQIVTSSTQALDEIVVLVNRQAITALDLKRRERFLIAQIKRSNQALPSAQELSSAVLERAVIETLMLQQAAVLGLVPTDEQVQQAIAENAVQSGLDTKQFISRVEQSGVSAAEYAVDLKNDMAMSSVREKALLAKVKVTEVEVDKFLKDPQSGIVQEFLVHALFLAKSEADSAQESEAKRAQAIKLLATAQSTPSYAAFSALQTTVVNPSNNTNQRHVVDLPNTTLEKMPELYSTAIEGMPIGATSNLLESSAGFYILRLAGKRSILPQVQQTKARHILLTVPSASEENAIITQIKQLHDRLTLNIDLFPSLAKEYGQDGSAQAGGDLGWAMPGDMVPEFERTMDTLKVGEMALPLRSQFGWHIVQVLDRKTAEMTTDRMRLRARNVLRLRKQDDALSEWFDQLKSQAYIEYKNNR